MRKNKAYHWIAFLFCFLPLSAHSQLKVGYVSYERIWTQAEPFMVAKERIDREFAPRDQDLKKQEEVLSQRKQEFERQIEALPEAERRAKARELVEADREFQRKIREFQEDLNRRQNEEIATLMDQVVKIIHRIAEQGRYDLIVQDAIYVNPKIDLTAQVLDALKKQGK